MTTNSTTNAASNPQLEPCPCICHELIASCARCNGHPCRMSSGEIDAERLATAIAEAAVKAGIIDGLSSLTGPQLVMLCDDLANCSRASDGGVVATDIRADRAYIAGAKFGWNCRDANDNKRFQAAIRARHDDIHTSSRHPHFTHADHERMKETLDALSDYPTEEEAEAALRACGTSGKEVVNEFIERLLKENLQLKNKLDATTPSPDAARQAASVDATEICDYCTIERVAEIIQRHCFPTGRENRED